MGKIGAGLGTFEMMGKTASFAPLYNGMAQITAQLAKAKAEAEKQRKKAEEEAMAKVDDFIVSDKNNYTQKYLPYATTAMGDLINRVAEDKAKYPNTWTNRVSQQILKTKNDLNWALEQSAVQRNIEKSAQEGYIVPEELLQAYKTNYGDVSDIAAIAPGLSDYNINVGPDGAISANLVKPVDLTDEFGKFKNNRALFLEPKLEFSQVTSPQGVKFDITKQVSSMDPASVDVFTKESMNNPSLRVSYLTDPNKRTQVNAIMQELSATPGYDQITPEQIKQLAVSRAIQSDIEKYDKTRSQITAQREAKGITINTAQKPVPNTGESVFYMDESDIASGSPRFTVKPDNTQWYNDYKDRIEKADGSYVRTDSSGGTFVYTMGDDQVIRGYEVKKGNVYGFNAQAVWEKQADKENFKGVTVDMFTDKKLYNPVTKELMGRSSKNDIVINFPGGVVTDYLSINGKVFAKVNFSLPSEKGFLRAGVNSFLVEVTRLDKLDNLGKNLASSESKKYASMYDYFKEQIGATTSADPWAGAEN